MIVAAVRGGGAVAALALLCAAFAFRARAEETATPEEQAPKSKVKADVRGPLPFDPVEVV